VPLPADIVGLVTPGKVVLDPYKDIAVKPDGTPFRFTAVHTWMGDDWQVVKGGIWDYQVPLAGAKITRVSADLKVDNQLSMLEDITASKSADAITIHPLDKDLLVPAFEKMAAAGIKVFFDTDGANTDANSGFVWWNYATPTGIQVIGKWLADKATTDNKKLVILELWGSRTLSTAIARSEGFHKGLGDPGNPLIEVIQSVDVMGNPEQMAAAIQDNMTKRPDIGAIYAHWGDGSGFVSGLKAVDRYVKIGQPGHVMVVPQDLDTTAIDALQNDYFDAIGSTGPWPMADTIMKYWLLNAVMGLDVPKEIDVTVVMITKANMRSAETRWGGGTLVFPLMPIGKFNEWPALDLSDMGLPFPTLEMRKQAVGY